MKIPSTARDYLLLPMQPTPNGNLHLGHASGPYLRADVLARHLRRAGHRVRLICGSDVHENWILLAGLQQGRTPEQTCRHYNRLIRADLAMLDVAIDEWVNPLDEAYARPYTAVHEEILAQLAAAGTAVQVAERFPVSTGSGRYVVGVWLLGRCPNCGLPGGGNCCENCGYHYQPSEILEPRSRLAEGELAWREETCWQLRPPSLTALLGQVERYDVPPDLLKTAQDYLTQTGGEIRLSFPSEWGIKGRGAAANTVLCNTYYEYSVFCGTLHERAEQAGGSLGVFATGSDVVTVGVFGIDNTIGGLVSSSAIALSHGGLRPFDHVAVNYFLDLEGSKFSTSRRHGIWISDLLGGTSLTADEVRWYLAHICPETGPENFAVSEFIARTNQLRDLVSQLIAPALARAGRTAPASGPAPALAAELERLIARQDDALDCRGLRIRDAVTTVDAWLADGQAWLAGAGPLSQDARAGVRDDGDQAVWWIRGLALLGEPFLPRLARILWNATGAQGTPTLAGFSDRVAAGARTRLPAAPAVTAAEIEPYVHLTGEQQ